MKVSRRRFLAAAAPALVGCSLRRKSAPPPPGGWVGDAQEKGHALRDRAPVPAVRERFDVPVVIVGGGIAGLCAAWRFAKRGFDDYVLLEMEDRAGGNARWGENEVSRFPWAAHYLPVPGPHATLVRELCTDLGLLRNGEWDERTLCHVPQERLFLHGRWQDGLEPATLRNARDRDQFRRFDDRIGALRKTGAFTIPFEDGFRRAPAELLALDRVPFADWLRAEGFDSPYLLWYAEYATRDDYGALARDTSAFAGLHYFACREPDERGPLTWPEGNGWLAERLLRYAGARVRTGHAVHRIEPADGGLRVLAGDAEWRARVVIFAAPTFLAPYLVAGFPRLPAFRYSPWLTANLTLDGLPDVPGPAWDNVIFDSPALGYVDATHQSMGRRERTVLTYYWALAAGTPADNRRALLARPFAAWREAILADLERAHPDIRTHVTRLDAMRLGHAMIRPAPGFLTAEERVRAARLDGSAPWPRGLLLANSDLSGLSLFEEAQYRGVAAAERALTLL